VSIISHFTQSYIVNLPERIDRRREMEKMLLRITSPQERLKIQYFPAVRPESADGFPSLGARGCFLSHLEILRRASAANLPNVLVMEDDLEMDSVLASPPLQLVEAVRSPGWDWIYFGYQLMSEAPPKFDGVLRPFAGPIGTTHFYAINGLLLPRLIGFLETVLSRPPGHPDGGPMHLDGAYTTFRLQNPEVRTLIACPSLGWQRSSHSDINPSRIDRIPIVRSLTRLLRYIRPRL